MKTRLTSLMVCFLMGCSQHYEPASLSAEDRLDEIVLSYVSPHKVLLINQEGMPPVGLQVYAYDKDHRRILASDLPPFSALASTTKGPTNPKYGSRESFELPKEHIVSFVVDGLSDEDTKKVKSIRIYWDVAGKTFPIECQFFASSAEGGVLPCKNDGPNQQ